MKRVTRLLAMLLCLAVCAAVLPLPAAASRYDGLTELSLGGKATATYEQTATGRIAAIRAIDGDLSTGWSTAPAGQKSPHAIQIDLGQNSRVAFVELWWQGEGSRYTFDVYLTSTPMVVNKSFSASASPLLTNQTGAGSGNDSTPPAYRSVQTLNLPENSDGQYLTLYIKEAAGGAIGLNELRVWGTSDAVSDLTADAVATATFEQSSGANCPARNAIDGSLATRWSTWGAEGRVPQAIQIDLRQTCAVSILSIWWYGAGRQATYDVYVTSAPTVTGSVFSTDASPVLTNCKGTGTGDATAALSTGDDTRSFPVGTVGRYVTLLVREVTEDAPVTVWDMKIMGRSSAAGDETTVTAYREEPSVTADVGTALNDLPLPQTVTATLSNGIRRMLPVSWSCPAYRADTAGTYTLTGQVTLPEGLSDPENRTVSKTVELIPAVGDGRTEYSLNEGWVFRKTAVKQAEHLGFIDTEFDRVDLPHTWNIEDGSDGDAKFYQGETWYRRHLAYRPSFDGKRLYLKFEGVSRECTVYVNGYKVGGHRGAYTAFTIDVTDALVPGDNLIAVKATNEIAKDLAPLSGDFTQFGGIYRDVTLIVTDECHVDATYSGTQGLFMTTTDVSAESATVGVKASIVNDAAASRTVQVRYQLMIPATEDVTWIDEIPFEWLPFDPADMTVEGGRTVYTVTKDLTLAAGETKDFTDTFAVSNPRLWDGKQSPFRYLGRLEILADGRVIDKVEDYVGFRTFTVDASTGAYLNGRSYNLMGVSRHQEREGMGNAITRKEHNEDLADIYEMGCNSIRLAHYPHATYFYNLCDQYGLLVWAEDGFVNDVGGEGTYDDPDTVRASFMETTRLQLTELIRQQYNHPSIVVWSIHNEVYPRHETFMLKFAQDLTDLCKREDPTRLVTQATANGTTPTWPSDLICTNFYPGWYYSDYTQLKAYVERFRTQIGGRPLGLSEFGIGANYMQHTDVFPAPVCNSGDVYEYEEYQSEAHESLLSQIQQMDYLWCAFIWVMFDFASDNRYEAQVGGINNKGLVSFDHQTRKDAYYLYKANWSDLPTLHLNSSRFYNRKSNKIVVKSYANCDEVSLYINGQLIGTKKQAELSQKNVFMWPDVALKDGKNTARIVGTRDGKTYEDSAEWYYVKVTSPTLDMRDNGTVVLPEKPLPVSRLQELFETNVDTDVSLLAEDGVTPVTAGDITEGMVLRVTYETIEIRYTFLRNNLALTATARATYEQNICPASAAIDGLKGTRWTSYGATTLPQSLEIDLGKSYALKSLEMIWFTAGRTYNYDLYVTDTPVIDGTAPRPTLENLKGIGQGDSNSPNDDATYDVLTLPKGTKGRYVTITVRGGTGIGTTAGLWEVGVYRRTPDAESLQQAEAAIAAIGDVTADNYAEKKAAIERAEQLLNEIRELYDEEGVRDVPNAEVLFAARSAYDRYAGIDKAVSAIRVIGEITAGNAVIKKLMIQTADNAVQDLIDQFGEDIVNEIANYNDLIAARESYIRLTGAAYAIDAIDAIGAVTADNYTDKTGAVAHAAFAADEVARVLGEEARKQITNADKLAAAEQAIKGYTAAAALTETIAQLGEITEANYKTKREALLAAEKALDDLEKTYGNDFTFAVPNLTDLFMARMRYDLYAGNDVTPGDINEDGSINASDALMALQHSVKLITLNDSQTIAADVNGDSQVNASDALLILQYSVKLIDIFPVEA